MRSNGNGQDHGTANGAPSPKNNVFTTLAVEEALIFEGFLKEFLQAEGHFVLRADSAAQALALTDQHQPDLILLNREMAGSNGQSFLAELLLRHPHAAIIVMATQPSVADVVEAMRLGAVDYLERPLDRGKLKKAIDVQKALYEVL
jgi:DNA-binding NtrC family response regulator